MKFREIFRFEFNYQFRHVSTWLLFIVFLFFGFMILRMITLADDTHLNAPGTIAFFTVFGTMIWLVIGGVVAGDAATRDIQARMHPITQTTPVSKLSYLGARFSAALVVNTLILVTLYAGFILSFYGPGAKTQFLGAFRLMSYLTNFGFLAFPTVFVTTAIQFSFAALSGRAIAGYIASVLIIIFSQFGGTTVRFMLEWKVLGGLMDLLGTSIVAEMEGWTPIDKNQRLIMLKGVWLWNRLTWFGIAALALSFTYFRFQFGRTHPGTLWPGVFRRRKAVITALQDSSDTSPSPAITTNRIIDPSIKRDFVFITHAHQAFAIAWTSFRAIARSRGGLTLVALLAIGTGLFATEYMEWLGVPLLARTQEVLSVLAPPLSSFRTQWIIIPLLSIFYAGELIWRERETGISELYDTTPATEWVMLLGKFLALGLLIFTWVSFLLMAGIINQLVMDYHHFEMGVYIKALFGIQLSNYLLFGMLVFVIHVLVNQKYIGHMVAICAYGIILFASNIGIEHNLLIYASDTGWSYSDIRGFEPFIKPLLWFRFYWASWAFLLAVLGTIFWVRTKEGGLKLRFQQVLHRLPGHKLAWLVAVALVVLTGGFIFYNTNLLNKYVNNADRLEMRAEYERRYGRYEHSIQPVLIRTKLQVEIYPDKRVADIRGTYHLVNRSNTTIDSIHLSTLPQQDINSMSFDRPVKTVVVDEALGYQVFTLDNKLEPGDSIEMKFELHIRPRGFNNDGVDASVVSNGSHVTSGWMPVIGYHADRRLHDARDREKYGLPSRPATSSLQDVAAHNDTRHAQQIQFEAIVGTAGDQVAVAPGALLRSWRKGDRRYFHYATNAPIHNEYAFFSARYALSEARWLPPTKRSWQTLADSVEAPGKVAKPVTIQVFYHPSHGVNVEHMLKSAIASLAYYSEKFGPYPYSHFRVLERPGAGRGMHAEPMTIDYQEGYSLMNPKPGGLNLPYHIMSHEVAHQWWGLYLSPAAVEGAGLLVESFATYSAMLVVEETLGYEHLLKYLSQMRLEYETPRSRAAPPLLRANDRFMLYRKGPFALFALRNYIGKDKVNQALMQMLPDSPSAPPLPTTLDFYKELKSVTPDSLQYLLHDLFAANTFWELKTEKAGAKRTQAGDWQVILDVQARKVVVDEQGLETEVPMNDWIEIGVFAGTQTDGLQSKPAYFRKHRIRSGKQRITVTVSQKPWRAGLDPGYLLMDLNMHDNIRKVKTE